MILYINLPRAQKSGKTFVVVLLDISTLTDQTLDCPRASKPQSSPSEPQQIWLR